MNDYSKTYFHLKKSQSFMNKERHNAENKSEIKFEKFKKITKPKDNINIKHRILKKMSQHHYSKTNQQQNQPTKKLSKEKYKQENKKITHNKSFNYGRNRQNDFSLQINNTYIPKEKSIKKIKLNNNEIFFDNYDKNLLHRKIYKNSNENNNHLTKINNTTQLEKKKFSNSYFNVVYKKDKSDDFFSRSQNFGNKKNALRKINTNLSVNKEKHNKSIFNNENDFNKSQSNFYSNKKLSNDFFRSKLLINNDYFNNNNNLVTDVNINREETCSSNNFNSINNCDNSTPINNHKPVKLYKEQYKDNNNTTFNLPGSFNFHQYFNTIINKTNNNKRNIINRNYNKNLASIESNNKLYNNCQTQICNTNESDNKFNTLSVNDPKLIEEINSINKDLENELKQNLTNSKSKKYNAIKRSFDKFIKTINEFFLNNDLHPIFLYLQKILLGYHNVILAFSGENRKLKELNYKLSEQYQKIDKNFIECNKAIKEKQNEIENLGKQISTLLSSLNEQKRINIILKCKLEEINMNNIKNNNNNNLEMNNSTSSKFLNDIEKTEQYIKIKNLNMNNLDDLDSLYFLDKINMKPKRAYSHGKIIPFLPINNINK